MSDAHAPFRYPAHPAPAAVEHRLLASISRTTHDRCTGDRRCPAVLRSRPDRHRREFGSGAERDRRDVRRRDRGAHPRPGGHAGSEPRTVQRTATGPGAAARHPFGPCRWLGPGAARPRRGSQHDDRADQPLREFRTADRRRCAAVARSLRAPAGTDGGGQRERRRRTGCSFGSKRMAAGGRGCGVEPRALEWFSQPVRPAERDDAGVRLVGRCQRERHRARRAQRIRMARGHLLEQRDRPAPAAHRRRRVEPVVGVRWTAQRARPDSSGQRHARHLGLAERERQRT